MAVVEQASVVVHSNLAAETCVVVVAELNSMLLLLSMVLDFAQILRIDFDLTNH